MLGKKVALVVLVIVVMIVFFVRPSLAQETSQPAAYVPGRVLVQYTDEAASVLFTRQPVLVKKNGPAHSWWQVIISFFGFSSSPPSLSAEEKIQQQSQALTSQFSISSQQALERAQPSAHTLQLGRGSFLPSLAEGGDDPLHHVYAVSLGQGSVEEAVDRFQKSGLVVAAQPDYVYTASMVPNDPQYTQMWSHQRIGSEQAWNTTTGSGNVIVAVTDSGIDYTHEDLQANIWTGDIGQGQQGHGYDYVSNDTDPMDENGHGTHVAGIIGAVGNNGIGVTGVNWTVKLMAVRVLDPNGGGSTTTVSQGIRFAADHGARVINISLGAMGSCTTPDAVTASAIAYATGKGALAVVATGNSSANGACDSPANDPNVLAVTARGPDDVHARYTNYGMLAWKITKLISAPGGNAASSASCTAALCTLSTKRGGGYSLGQGTSFSAPYVSGAAALVLSVSSLTPQQLRSVLVDSSDDLSDDFTTQINPNIPSDDGHRSYGKRLNLAKAIAAVMQPTATPTSLPSVTPIRTVTPIPSSTPQPTLLPTATAQPTLASQPTATPIVVTPSPTGISALSPTPLPTGSVVPTPTGNQPSPTVPIGATPTTVVPTPTSAVTRIDVDIWVVLRKNGKKTRLKDGTRVGRNDDVAICYNRASGPFMLTVERGNGRRKIYRRSYSKAAKNKCLTVNDRTFFDADTLFRADGKAHRITLKSGGKRATFTLRVGS